MTLSTVARPAVGQACRVSACYRSGSNNFNEASAFCVKLVKRTFFACIPRKPLLTWPSKPARHGRRPLEPVCIQQLSSPERAAVRAAPGPGPREDSRGARGRRRGNGPTEQQRELNGLILNSTSSEHILAALDAARHQGVTLTSVNMVTALSCLEKTVRRTHHGSRPLARDRRFQLFLEQMWTQMEEDPLSFEDRGLATVAYSLAKLGDGCLGGLSRMEGVVIRRLTSLSPRHISNITWAFAKRNRGESLFLDVDAEVRQRGLADFNAQDLSNILWAYATAGMPGHQLYKAADLEITRRGLDGFNPQCIANIAWALAKAGRHKAALFGTIQEEVMLRGLASFNAQNISNTVWAFATAGQDGTGLFATAESELIRRGLSGFKPQEIANTVWAFATGGKGSSALSAVVESEVMSRGLHGFTSQGISNTIWGFASAGHGSPEFYAAVDAEVVERGLASFEPQNISNILWAFAKAGRYGRVFVAVESGVLAHGLAGFNEQSIANILCAFASAGAGGPGLYSAVEEEVLRRGLSAFKLQEVSSLLGAFAKTGCGHPPVYTAIEEEMARRGLSGFDSPGLSHAVWAFAKAGHEGEGLIFALAEAEVAARGLDGFTLQDISSMVWGYAIAGRGTEAIYRMVEERVMAQGMKSFTPHGLSTVLWAFASASQGSDEFYTAAEAAIAEWDPKDLIDVADVANTLWAFAVVGRADSAAARSLLLTSHASLSLESSSLRHLGQVCQYILASLDAKRPVHDPTCHSVLQAWHQASKEACRPGPSSSAFHSEVSSLLWEMGIRHENEVPYHGGLLYMDIMVGDSVVVEVDGPCHFRRSSRIPTATTNFKRQLLEKGCLRVVSVPYFEWESLLGPEVKCQYIRAKLAACGVHATTT